MGPNWDQTGTKMRPNWDQTGTKMGPNWEQTGTQLQSGSCPVPETQKVPKVWNRSKKPGAGISYQHQPVLDFGNPWGLYLTLLEPYSLPLLGNKFEQIL